MPAQFVKPAHDLRIPAKEDCRILFFEWRKAGISARARRRDANGGDLVEAVGCDISPNRTHYVLPV